MQKRHWFGEEKEGSYIVSPRFFFLLFFINNMAAETEAKSPFVVSVSWHYDNDGKMHWWILHFYPLNRPHMYLSFKMHYESTCFPKMQCRNIWIFIIWCFILSYISGSVRFRRYLPECCKEAPKQINTRKTHKQREGLTGRSEEGLQCCSPSHLLSARTSTAFGDARLGSTNGQNYCIHTSPESTTLHSWNGI